MENPKDIKKNSLTYNKNFLLMKPMSQVITKYILLFLSSSLHKFIITTHYEDQT